MNRVFVLSNTKKPLMPCSPARARRLLNGGKAAVFRMQPFTIILKHRSDGNVQDVEFKIDPGSKATGIALVGDFPKKGKIVLWCANLGHRGLAIKDRLLKRRAVRSARRSRNTRYRPARWRNRARYPMPGFQKWIPPSLRSRVDNIRVWYERLLNRVPLTSAVVETVRFDTQKLQNPEILGVQYQQGTLFGYELREYLLEKWDRKCAYCGAENVPLEIEHIVPKSKGGTDRVSNLALACNKCNQKKGNKPVEEFLKKKHDVLNKVKAQAKASLKDAAAMNTIRYEVGNAIKNFGLPVSFWSGGRTKMNRIAQGYQKDHWIDAACVGETGESVKIPEGMKPLNIKATGRGKRQVVDVNKYGFPRSKAKKGKRFHGFQTGDLVKLVKNKGKCAGTHIAPLISVRPSGSFHIRSGKETIAGNYKDCTLLQRADGYAYS